MMEILNQEMDVRPPVRSKRTSRVLEFRVTAQTVEMEFLKYVKGHGLKPFHSPSREPRITRRRDE